MTFLLISIVIFSVIALIVHLITSTPFYFVESAIAGDLNSIKEKDNIKEFTKKIKIKRNVLFETEVHRFRLKENSSLVIAADSVAPANINKGDLIFLEKVINPQTLKKGDIVAFKTPADHSFFANKIKLRVIDYIKSDKDDYQFFVKKYNINNELVNSEGSYHIKNLVGKCAAIFSHEELKRILY